MEKQCYSLRLYIYLVSIKLTPKTYKKFKLFSWGPTIYSVHVCSSMCVLEHQMLSLEFGPPNITYIYKLTPGSITGKTTNFCRALSSFHITFSLAHQFELIHGLSEYNPFAWSKLNSLIDPREAARCF